MAYHKDGLNKVPGWMVNLVVAIVGVGALAVLFTVGCKICLPVFRCIRFTLTPVHSGRYCASSSRSCRMDAL